MKGEGGVSGRGVHLRGGVKGGVAGGRAGVGVLCRGWRGEWGERERRGVGEGGGLRWYAALGQCGVSIF